MHELQSIVVSEVKQEARRKGYEYGEKFDVSGEDVEDIEREISLAEDGLLCSAAFSNSIAPRLREMSGYGDRFNAGTYQQARPIRADGEEISSQYVYDEVMGSFFDGYAEAVREELER